MARSIGGAEAKPIAAIGLLSALGLGLVAVPALAEEAEPSNEIEVTAQRRVQPASDVGIALTVIDGDEIGYRRWRTSEDIAAVTPGMVATSFSGSNSIGLFALRGVAQNDFIDHQEAPVAIYVDQGYQPFTGAATTALFDVERVEVLRGPQGTLFGRNATGGLVNLVTRTPTRTFEGHADVAFENYDTQRFEAALGGPVTPWLRFRIAGLAERSDGYFETPDVARAPTSTKLFGAMRAIADAPVSGHLRSRDNSHLRLKLEADPLPGLTLGYSYSAGRVDRERNGYDTLPAPAGVIDPSVTDFYGTPFDPRPLRENPDLIGYVDKRMATHLATAALEVGRWRLDLLGQSGHLRKSYLEDDDGGPFAIGLFGTRQDARHRSAELRATGPLGPATLTVGANILSRRGDYLATFQFPAITGASGPGVADGFGLGYDADYSHNTRATALFGQAEWPLGGDLRLIGGLRWTHERQRFFIAVTCVNDPATAADNCAAGGVLPGSIAALGGTVRLSQRADLFSGKLQLEYTPGDGRLFWLGYNRGVKGGGFTVPLDGIQVADRLAYRPETLHAIEAGTKLEIGGVSLSAAAFAYLYEDYQGFVIEGPTTIVGNFPAHIHGAEVEAEGPLPLGLRFSLGLSILHARVRDVEIAPGVRDSQRMTLAPPLGFNASLTRDTPLAPRMTLRSFVAMNYSGAISYNTINSPLVRATPHALVDAGATLEFPLAGRTANVGLYVRNLFDARPLTYAFDLSGFFGNVLQAYGPPRTIGITTSVTF